MNKFKPLMWVFFFGSIWGLNEVFLGEMLYRNEVSQSAVILTVIAFFLLAISRGLINRPGSSTLIGLVAVLFRLVNTGPSYCHLLGIFLLGITYDVFASIFVKNDEKTPLRWSLTGALSAFGNNVLFAILITYLIRYEYWIAGGFSKVTDHIFVSGSISATLAAVFVPLGIFAGRNISSFADSNTRWSFASPIAFSIALWAVALFLN
jgi:hypothetical protein